MRLSTKTYDAHRHSLPPMLTSIYFLPYFDGCECSKLNFIKTSAFVLMNFCYKKNIALPIISLGMYLRLIREIGFLICLMEKLRKFRFH